MWLRFSGFILLLGFVLNAGMAAQANTIAQATPAPSSDKPSQGSSFYDRYMQAGYSATKQRNFPTALLYFKRALDERPDDTYAAQAIRNVEGYITGKPAPSQPSTAQSTTKQPETPNSSTPSKQPVANGQPSTKPPATPNAAATPKPSTGPANSAPSKPPVTSKPTTPAAKPPTPPTKLAPPPKAPPATAAKPRATEPTSAVVFVPSEPPSAAFSEQQAIALINRWLQAKVDIFAPPYDQQQISDLTTGELLASLVRPNGIVTWLKGNRAYYRYGVQKVDSIERFVVARDRATIELNLTEDRTLYLNGAISPQHTDFSSQRVRFNFELVDGTWKIADYKTVNGSLLERSILEATRSTF